MTCDGCHHVLVEKINSSVNHQNRLTKKILTRYGRFVK